MTSPYLDHIRATRNIIEELILAREFEMAKTIAAAQRQRVEWDLIFLRDELARIDGPSGWQAATNGELRRDERARERDRCVGGIADSRTEDRLAAAAW
jgi:hypothetical protein